MDPNLPQTPNLQPHPKRNIIVITIITVIIVILIAAALTYSPNLFKKQPAPVKQPQQTIKSSLTITPPKLQTPKGVVTSLTANSLTIKPEATGSANITFTISDNTQIQRLTAGTIEGPGTKLAKAALSDLKVGQKVYIIANGQNEATTVIILK